MLRNVHHATLKRDSRRWLLIRADVDQGGRIPRGGLAHLVARVDGTWEWRAAGEFGRAASRELAELAVHAAWSRRAPVADATRRCVWCSDELPDGSTCRRRFCGDACRVSAHRAKRSAPETRIRVRRATTRRTLGRTERAAARVRARVAAGEHEKVSSSDSGVTTKL